jgi:hypothetical protein
MRFVSPELHVFNTRADLSYLYALSFNTFACNRVVTNQPRTIGLQVSVRY